MHLIFPCVDSLRQFPTRCHTNDVEGDDLKFEAKNLGTFNVAFLK
jgi:hypothetical protein